MASNMIHRAPAVSAPAERRVQDEVVVEARELEAVSVPGRPDILNQEVSEEHMVRSGWVVVVTAVIRVQAVVGGVPDLKVVHNQVLPTDDVQRLARSGCV